MPVCSGAMAMGDVSLVGFGWNGQVRRPDLGCEADVARWYATP